MPELEKIKIELQGIGYALKNNRLYIPKYQRSYAWNEKNVTDLFTDITSTILENGNEYFLGSIVISYKDATHPEVVDGQQRLATTLILLAAIRDYFVQHNESIRANELTTRFLVDTDLESLEISQKLQLNESDNNFFFCRVLLPP